MVYILGTRLTSLSGCRPVTLRKVVADARPRVLIGLDTCKVRLAFSFEFLSLRLWVLAPPSAEKKFRLISALLLLDRKYPQIL